MKLIVSNGSEYTINDFTSNSFLIDFETFSEAANAYQEITSNMSKVTVEKDGEVAYSAENLISDGVQFTPVENGYMAILYYHGAKIATDREYAIIGRILMGEEK